jgi:hypothetical protein
MRRTSLPLLLVLAFLGCATATTFPDDDSGTPTPDGGGGDGGACTAMCGNVCVDTKTDGNNCGKCGTVCAMGATCVQGSCQCASGQMKCGATCVDPKTDDMNCGKCGQACGADAGAIMGGGMWKCTNGSCAIVCPMGKTECNGACVDVKTDFDNCGMCSNACMMGEQCLQGLCCKMGETVCNMQCADLQNDPNNCGMCGKQCPMNMMACVSGTCTSATYHWELVEPNACNAWCSGNNNQNFQCGSSFACDSTHKDGFVWIYSPSQNPPPNPVSSNDYGWVNWYCGSKGCFGMQGVQSQGTCQAPQQPANTVWQCVYK